MAYINLSPPASSLIDSIRNIGYTFESAVADIVDNSLSYRSKNIDISVQMEDEICILISDDGTGMTYNSLGLSARNSLTALTTTANGKQWTINGDSLTSLIPTFDPINPIFQGGSLSALPTTSLNGVIGTWSPALNNQTTK